LRRRPVAHPNERRFRDGYAAYAADEFFS